MKQCYIRPEIISNTQSVAMVGSLGGPLLRVEDLLSDLSRDDDDGYDDSNQRPTSTGSQPQELTGSLHSIFEVKFDLSVSMCVFFF